MASLLVMRGAIRVRKTGDKAVMRTVLFKSASNARAHHPTVKRSAVTALWPVLRRVTTAMLLGGTAAIRIAALSRALYVTMHHRHRVNHCLIVTRKIRTHRATILTWLDANPLSSVHVRP